MFDKDKKNVPGVQSKDSASGGCVRLGEFLLQNGVITEDQLNQALDSQKHTGRKLGSILVDMGLLTEQELCEELSDRLSVPYFDLDHYIIDPKVVQMVPEHLCERYRLIGIRKSGDTLTVAMTNTFDEMALIDLRILTGFEIKPVLATPSAISKALTKAFGTIDYASSLLEAMASVNGGLDIKERLYKMLEASERAKGLSSDDEDDKSGSDVTNDK